MCLVCGSAFSHRWWIDAQDPSIRTCSSKCSVIAIKWQMLRDDLKYGRRRLG